MKKFMILLAIFMAAVLSFAPRAKGVGTPQPPPIFIPAGSMMKVLDDIVTNRRWMTNGLYTQTYWELVYTNTSGGTRGRAISGSQLPFSSYENYRVFSASNVINTIYNTLKTNTDIMPGTTVKYTAVIFYTDGPRDYYALTIVTNVGPMSGITSNMIYNSWSDGKIVRVIFPLPGLQRYRSEVWDNDPSYTYLWQESSSSLVESKTTFVDTVPRDPIPPAGEFRVKDFVGYKESAAFKHSQVEAATPPLPHPPELTTSGILNIHAWCLTNGYRARFEVVAGGKTNIYTQMGEVVREPKPEVLRYPLRLGLSLAAGEDAVIEFSPNLNQPITWSTFCTITSAPTNAMSIPINSNLPQSFFRVKPNSWQ